MIEIFVVESSILVSWCFMLTSVFQGEGAIQMAPVNGTYLPWINSHGFTRVWQVVLEASPILFSSAVPGQSVACWRMLRSTLQMAFVHCQKARQAFRLHRLLPEADLCVTARQTATDPACNAQRSRSFGGGPARLWRWGESERDPFKDGVIPTLLCHLR